MDENESRLRPDRGVFPLSELADRSAADFGDRPVMRTSVGDGKYKEITFNELRDKVHAVTRWLIARGIEPGDRVAVLGENRPEWSMSYLGLQKAGAIAVPVDRLMTVSGIRHIIADSGSRVLFVSGQYMSTIEEMRSVETLETIVCFDETSNDEAVSFGEVISGTAGGEARFPERTLGDLAAILYTSGTTGHSKGVVLSHGNIASNVASASRIFDIGPEDTFISVLPVHHSFEATCGFLLPIYCGSSITYARSLKSNEIIEDIRNTNVTMMVGVPLLYEKMHQGIMRKVKQQGKDKLVNVLIAIVGLGEKLGLNLGKPLFKSLRQKGGLDSVRYFVSGGGPLDPTTAIFFNRLGLILMQGYGLTETSPITHVNPPWKVRHECAGDTMTDVECKIVDPNDQGVGEVCIRGPNVFQGYYKNDEATKEVMTEDGWFLTGDLGIIHKDGYLQVTGRKKNMLVTGGGKNVYPEEIEHHLLRNPYIEEVLVLGIPREKGMGDEVAALVYPNFEQVDLHFEELGTKPSDDDVFQLIKSEIKKAQKELADYKNIRRFRLVEEEFQKTSTKKIKRFLYRGDMVLIDGEKV